MNQNPPNIIKHHCWLRWIRSHCIRLTFHCFPFMDVSNMVSLINHDTFKFSILQIGLKPIRAGNPAAGRHFSLGYMFSPGWKTRSRNTQVYGILQRSWITTQFVFRTGTGTGMVPTTSGTHWLIMETSTFKGLWKIRVWAQIHSRSGIKTPVSLWVSCIIMAFFWPLSSFCVI